MKISAEQVQWFMMLAKVVNPDIKRNIEASLAEMLTDEQTSKATAVEIATAMFLYGQGCMAAILEKEIGKSLTLTDEQRHEVFSLIQEVILKETERQESIDTLLETSECIADALKTMDKYVSENISDFQACNNIRQSIGELYTEIRKIEGKYTEKTTLN